MRARTRRLRSLFCGTVNTFRLDDRPTARGRASRDDRRAFAAQTPKIRECAPLRPRHGPVGDGPPGSASDRAVALIVDHCRFPEQAVAGETPPGVPQRGTLSLP